MASIIALPNVAWTSCDLKAIVPRSTDRMEGRRTEAQKFGQWYWTIALTSQPLYRREAGMLDAFKMQAGDDGEVFLAYDAFRPRPIRMDAGRPLSGAKAGGGAFDGTGTLSSRTALSASVSGLPAGFLLSRGDYVEFRQSPTKRSLHIITADATASGSGSVTIQFKHGLDLQHFLAGATVNFEKASFVAQIDPGSWDGAKASSTPAFSFTATEVFLP